MVHATALTVHLNMKAAPSRSAGATTEHRVASIPPRYVAVLPEAEEVEVQSIPQKSNLMYSGPPARGQSVNTTIPQCG